MKNKLLLTVISFTLINIALHHVITDIPYLFSTFTAYTRENFIVNLTLGGGFHILFVMWNALYNYTAFTAMKKGRINKYERFLYSVSYVIFALLSYLVVPLDSYVGIVYALIGTCITNYLIYLIKKEKRYD